MGSVISSMISTSLPLRRKQDCPVWTSFLYLSFSIAARAALCVSQSKSAATFLNPAALLFMAAMTVFRSSLPWAVPAGLRAVREARRTASAAHFRVNLPVRVLTFTSSLPYPGAIGDDVPSLVAHGFNTFDAYRAGQRPQQTLEIDSHHAFILCVNLRRVYLVDHALGAVGRSLNATLQELSRLVFEIDEVRPHKNKNQDQRDHHVIVKAAALVGPEDVTFDGAPHARHVFQSKLLKGERQFTRADR